MQSFPFSRDRLSGHLDTSSPDTNSSCISNLSVLTPRGSCLRKQTSPRSKFNLLNPPARPSQQGHCQAFRSPAKATLLPPRLAWLSTSAQAPGPVGLGWQSEPLPLPHQAVLLPGRPSRKGKKKKRTFSCHCGHVTRSVTHADHAP